MPNIFRSRPSSELQQQERRAWVSTWLPCLLAMAVIAVESTDTFSAQHTSGWLRPVMENIFGRIHDAVWWAIHHYARKTGHFCGYGAVCLTFLRAWLRTLQGHTLAGWRARAAGLAILCTACVASADEWHQTFIPSRTGEVSDVLLDTLGGSVACLLVALVFRWWRGTHSQSSGGRARL